MMCITLGNENVLIKVCYTRSSRAIGIKIVSTIDKDPKNVSPTLREAATEQPMRRAQGVTTCNFKQVENQCRTLLLLYIYKIISNDVPHVTKTWLNTYFVVCDMM